MMRAMGGTSGSLFSYVDLEERIPPRHPLRKICQAVKDALASLDAEFECLHADFGRPSIAPERLIRASLIQILFSIRSGRQLMQQMQHNLLFRWFAGLGVDGEEDQKTAWGAVFPTNVRVPTVFTKNRDRLMTTDMSRKVMAAILAHREIAPLLSDEHFSVDGTLIKARVSMKRFRPKVEGAPPDDEGPDDPPSQYTSPDDQPAHPETETEPMRHSSRRNRNKGHDAAEFVSGLRQACVTPHVARKSRYSAIDGRTTRHEGYALSLKHRKRIEEAFGWAKTVGGMARTVCRGVERVRSRFILTMAANNLARLPRLSGA